VHQIKKVENAAFTERIRGYGPGENLGGLWENEKERKKTPPYAEDFAEAGKRTGLLREKGCRSRAPARVGRKNRIQSDARVLESRAFWDWGNARRDNRRKIKGISSDGPSDREDPRFRVDARGKERGESYADKKKRQSQKHPLRYYEKRKRDEKETRGGEKGGLFIRQKNAGLVKKANDKGSGRKGLDEILILNGSRKKTRKRQTKKLPGLSQGGSGVRMRAIMGSQRKRTGIAILITLGEEAERPSLAH